MTKKKSKYKVKECKYCIYCEPYNEEFSLCYLKGDINYEYIRHPFKCKEGEPKETKFKNV